MHGTIGMMSCWNNGLGSLWVIFLYRSVWNSASLSGFDNCPYMFLWNPHTILSNWINYSYLSLALTVSPAQRGSILKMSLVYSYLGANQTVAIWIKSQERLILSPHALRSSSHWEYSILVRNTWVIRSLKERGTKRQKRSRVNIYASNCLIFNFNFQGPPPNFKDYIWNKGCTSQKYYIDIDQKQQNIRYIYVDKYIEQPNKKFPCEMGDVKQTHFTQIRHLLPFRLLLLASCQSLCSVLLSAFIAAHCVFYCHHRVHCAQKNY